MGRSGRLQLAAMVGAVVAGTALSPRTSQASAVFPGEIASRLGMPCPPPCNLCHISPQGGDPLNGEPFVAAMLFKGGLKRGDVASVAPALGALDTAMPPIDGDMDGTED